jgi:hypothetical protein
MAAFLLLFNAVHAQERDLSAFGWLAGGWESREGPTTEERWTAPTSNLMLGVSRTVKEGRTVGFEFLRLEKRGADIYYVPQPSGRPPVDFKLTSAENGAFVCENTEGVDRVHRIEYRREGKDASTPVSTVCKTVNPSSSNTDTAVSPNNQQPTTKLVLG